MADRRTVPAVLRRFDEELAEGSELRELVEAVTTWQCPPESWCGGRAGWQPLPSELAERIGIRALKFKGLGQAPLDGREARPPSSRPYDRWPGQAPDPHFGIRSDLEFTLISGDPAPIGGLYLRSAHREFDCAHRLVAHGVPSVRPVAVVEYPDRRFPSPVGEPLGVGVTGSPVPGMLRCSVLLPGPRWSDPAVTAEIGRLARVLNVSGVDPTSPAGRVRVLGAVYRAFGVSLAAFSAAGCHRYSGHADNVVIDDDGRAVLIDLDSSVLTASDRGDLAALQAVRDGMSALYNLACAFFPAPVLDGIPDDVLLAEEPFSAFLDGWNPCRAGTNRGIGAAIARYVIESRAQLRRFGAFLSGPTVASRQLYRHVRHDRDLTFIWLYRVAFRRIAVALPFGLEDLDERLLRFAGRERFERMQVWELRGEEL